MAAISRFKRIQRDNANSSETWMSVAPFYREAGTHKAAVDLGTADRATVVRNPMIDNNDTGVRY